MKKLFTILALIVTLILSAEFSTTKAQTSGCSNGKINGIYHTSCYADTGDDTQRIQQVVDAASVTGGKIIFNEAQYEVSSSITLNSFLILEGQAVGSLDSLPTTRIKLTAVNKSIFNIGSGIYEVSVRDIALVATSTDKTIGIKAEGNNGTGGAGASAKFQFSNIRFSGFDKGIYVKANLSPFDWQFDHVRLDHSTFENCNTGIEIDAYNSGWYMSNVAFVSPTNGNGIKIIRGGYISMNLVIGHGTKDALGKPTSDTLFYIKEHSVISIQNSSAEGFLTTLNLDGLAKDYPVHLINNGFAGCDTLTGEPARYNVIVKNSTVVSTGNFYGCFTGPASPKIQGFSDVFSIGDRFCYLASQHCNASKFTIEGNQATLYIANPLDNLINPGDELRPMLSMSSPFDNAPFLRMGSGLYHYTLMREASTGWLKFQGSQSSPYAGYKFEGGPVQLTSVTHSNLQTTVVSDGSMIYCSNCQPNTTPCQSGGNGALAVRVNSQWSCK